MKAKLINRSELLVGDIVANRVEDASGRLLINSGTELTEKHLRALAMWGIEQVAIPVADDATNQEKILSSAELQAGKDAIESLFSCCNQSDPFVSALHSACAKRKAYAILNH